MNDQNPPAADEPIRGENVSLEVTTSSGERVKIGPDRPGKQVRMRRGPAAARQVVEQRGQAGANNIVPRSVWHRKRNRRAVAELVLVVSEDTANGRLRCKRWRQELPPPGDPVDKMAQAALAGSATATDCWMTARELRRNYEPVRSKREHKLIATGEQR